MAKGYVNFTHGEFSRSLRGIELMIGLGESFEDVTREIGTGEVVYELDVTREFGWADGVSRRLRVYTTIDERTGRVLSIGSMKVKVLLVVESKGVLHYSLVGNHLRIATLFDNLKETIDRTLREVNSGVSFNYERCLLSALTGS